MVTPVFRPDVVEEPLDRSGRLNHLRLDEYAEALAASDARFGTPRRSNAALEAALLSYACSVADVQNERWILLEADLVEATLAYRKARGPA